MAANQEWTLLIAGYAAIVSTGLLILRIAELKLEAGWISVSTSLVPFTNELPPVLLLKAVNRGRGAAMITRVDLIAPGPVFIALSAENLITAGPEFPYTLAPRTSATWEIDGDRLKLLSRRQGWSPEVRGSLVLATGKRVWESIHKHTTLQ